MPRRSRRAYRIQARARDRRVRRPGRLGDALRNLERYVQNQTFNNPQGGANDPGSAIQFDTKGVEFGPWIRRFVAQVRRNWFIPNAAMNFRGHVVIQFNIHKNGRITDVHVVQPSSINAFNRAAYNAIVGSNPTEPLPPEYPDPDGVLHGHVLLQRAASGLSRADANAAARADPPAPGADGVRLHKGQINVRRLLIAAAAALLWIPGAATQERTEFFIQLADPQFGAFAQKDEDFTQETTNYEFAVANVNRLRPAFVVICGDLINKTGDKRQADEYFRITSKIDRSIPVHAGCRQSRRRATSRRPRR